MDSKEIDWLLSLRCKRCFRIGLLLWDPRRPVFVTLKHPEHLECKKINVFRNKFRRSLYE